MNRPLPAGYLEVDSEAGQRLDEAGVDVVIRVHPRIGTVCHAPEWCITFVEAWHEARDLQYASIDLMVRAVRFLRRNPDVREETAGAVLALLRLGGSQAVANYLHEARDYLK